VKNADSTSQPVQAPIRLPGSKEELQQVLEQLYGSTPSTSIGLTRCCICGRLSKTDPGSIQYSIDIQTNQTVEYARSQGWEIVGIYNDTGITGRHSRRNGLQQVIHDIKTRRTDVVLFHRVDRSFRNLGSLIKFMNLASRYHVRVIFVTEQFDTDSPGGRMMLYMSGAFAELYVRITSERVREMKEARFERGLPNGSFRLGYCNGLCSRCTDPNGPGYCPLVGGSDRGDGRVLVPHPIEQHAARLIAYLYHDHWSYRAIADYLNSNAFRLPDGQVVRFRTKGVAGQSLPGLFTESAIRIRILSPFDTGFIARYPSKPLDMEDDPEHPDRKPDRPKQKGPNRRIPLQLIRGRHEAIIPFQIWQQNQIIRQNKSHTSTTNGQSKRINPYANVARCWECYSYDGTLANLRGSTGSSDRRSYGRCGRWQDAYRRRKQQPALPADSVLASLDLATDGIDRELADRHHNVPIDKIKAEFHSLFSRLAIPPEWYDLIVAYFLNDDGLSEYKRETYELRQEMERVKNLHSTNMLSRAQAMQKISQINAQLRRLQPSTHPAASTVIPLLQDFRQLWRQLEPLEQRGLLNVVFTGVFFDAQGNSRAILANSPFDALMRVEGNDPIVQ
jgi:site-specific DNA recombinase